LLKYFSLPFAIAAAVCITYYPPLTSVLLLAAFAIEANILIALVMAIRPRIPLSHEHLPGQGYVGLIASFGFNWASMILNVALFFMVWSMPIAGVVLACASLLMLAVIAYGLNRLAINRIFSTEFEL